MRRLRRGALAALCLIAIAGAAAPDAPVADAAMRGDAEAVRQLVRAGADVNAAQGDGMTALHWAAFNGDAAVAGLLLEAGASLAPTTRNGAYQPLHLAARHGHAAVVTALLAAGADPHATTATAGTTALHLAAAAGSAETVTALLDGGALVDAQEEAWGQTPLVFATAANRLDVMRVLLARGANPSHVTRVVDLKAQAAVDAAARAARDQVLETLAAGDPGFKPSPTQMQTAVAAARRVQREGRTVAAGGDGPLEDGEISLDVETMGGLTPLLHAAREGHREAALLLLDAGADLEQAKAGDGTTPLLMSIINGHYDLALDLLERGADPNRAGTDGAGPLFAVLNNYWAPKTRYPQQHAYLFQEASYLETMKALLEAGADPNARVGTAPWFTLYTFGSLGVSLNTATPFWRAAHATDVDAMRLLVEHGADPSLPTLAPPPTERRPRGAPPVEAPAEPVQLLPAVWPIHAAAGVGYAQGYTANFHRHSPGGWMPAMRYLVEELGADVHQLDNQGYNAIHHAASRGDNEMILYLVEKGVDPTVVARNGRTTADMANAPGQRLQPFPETIALLVSLGAVNNNRCVSC